MSRISFLRILLSITLVISSGVAHGFAAVTSNFNYEHAIDSGTVNALTNLAKKYVRSDVSLADSLVNEAYNLLGSMKYPEGLARCLILLSDIEITKGNLDAGFDYGRQAITISEELDNQELISESYSQLYLLYFQRGDYDSATIAAEKSLTIAQEINHMTMLGRGNQNFGILNSIKGNHSKAIEHFLLSEKYYEALEDMDALALLVGNLGVTFEESGNLEKAKEYMHKQLVLSKLINNRNLQGWAMTNIGAVHSMQGEKDSAMYYYVRSLRLSKESSNHDLTIHNFDNIGSYWSSVQQYDSAAYYLMAALKLSESSGFSYQEVYVVGHIAENYLAMGKLDSALFYAEKQLALATDQELQVDQKMAYSLIARIHAGKSQFHQAFDALTNYVSINDTLYNQDKTQQIEGLRESYETEKKDQEISSLKQQQEAAKFRRNTYVAAGFATTLLLTLLYSRQRLISRKDRQLLDKSQEVEKMKSRFFSNISHEFRTPLTLILGPIETLNESIQDHHSKFQLSVMRKSAKRLLTLTNQLLDLSKLESGSLKLSASKQDIVMLVKGVVMSFNTMAEIKNITLSIKTEIDHLNLYADREKIETIIINLLSNAFKFTPNGGAISVALKEDGKHCHIVVTDDGEGISPDDLAHIFDRFYQGSNGNDHAPQGATGIGLALVKELVELHGGAVEAQSQLKKGTTIIVKLPLGKDHLSETDIVIPVNAHNPVEDQHYEASLSVQQDTVDYLSENLESKPLLLIIEDNNDVMNYIKTVLHENYQIAEAFDGEHGITMARDIIPDLILCDVMMPLKDGYEVCSVLKQDEKTSHIPIILLTAKSSSEDRIHGLLQAADDYVSKPFVPRELEARMHNLIESRRRLREKFKRSVMLLPNEIEVTSIDEAFLQRVMGVIEKNMADEDFSVEQLGKEVGMSRSQIHRKLHALTNQSATQLIRTVRLTRAKSMIEQNAGTISEIAYSVGFSSPSYFNRCFLQEFGCTPTEVRSATHNPERQRERP